MKSRLSVILVLFVLIFNMLPAAAQDAPAADVYPLTVTHQFGETTIPAAPKRIVSIGYTEQDYLWALGVQPIAVRYWYGPEDSIFPWMVDYIEGEKPEVLNLQWGALNYEAILALQPDLISAVTSGINEDEYKALSEIAPTLTQPPGYNNFGVPWQAVTRTLGEALNKTEEAEALVEATDALFTEAIEANPNFAGKTVAVSYFTGDTFGIFTSGDTRGGFFVNLGFVIPEEFEEIAAGQFYAELSTERADLLDQDLIAIANSDLSTVDGLKEHIIFSQLDVVKENRVVALEETAKDALSFNTPLSIPYVLEEVLPQLEALFSADDAEVVALECEEGFRAFDHEYHNGEPVCIPVDPQRIAVLDLPLLEVVLIEGIEPVAMFGYGRDLIARSNPNINVDVLGLTAETVDVGNSSTINLEALLAAAPDLIIANDYGVNSTGLETLSEIAPTVIFSYPLTTSEYRSSVEFGTAVLNVPESGEEILAQLDARMAAFKEALGDGVGSTEISLVRQRETVVLFTGGSFGDHVITEAGLLRPEVQRQYDVDFAINDNNGRVGFDVSPENLPVLDGEYIFIWTAGTSADIEEQVQGILDSLKEDPLWNTLEGVKNEKLFIVGSHWQGFGILEAQTALDDLFRYVAEVDPQEVAPNPFLAE